MRLRAETFVTGLLCCEHVLTEETSTVKLLKHQAQLCTEVALQAPAPVLPMLFQDPLKQVEDV